MPVGLPDRDFYRPRRFQPYQYEEGQMYDPFRMGKLFRTRGIPGKTIGELRLATTTSRAELGKEFSGIYGGRPLSTQEVQPLLPQAPGHDPRMGTIGGMPERARPTKTRYGPQFPGTPSIGPI